MTLSTLINSHGLYDNPDSSLLYASLVSTCKPYEVRIVGCDEAVARGIGMLCCEPSHADDTVLVVAPST